MTRAARADFAASEVRVWHLSEVKLWSAHDGISRSSFDLLFVAPWPTPDYPEAGTRG